MCDVCVVYYSAINLNYKILPTSTTRARMEKSKKIGGSGSDDKIMKKTLRSQPISRGLLISQI